MVSARLQKLKLGGAGLIALVALTLTTPASASEVSGGAYGASVNALGASLADTPEATLDPARGVTTAELASVSVPGVLTTGTLQTSSSGVVAENASTAESRAVVQSVSILEGVIKADLVVAMASSASNGTTAESYDDGSTFVNLSVNGTPISGPVEPNTRITIPGVGVVTLNEQSSSGDGVIGSGLQVQMIHLRLTDPLTGLDEGDIVVASASSTVSFDR